MPFFLNTKIINPDAIEERILIEKPSKSHQYCYIEKKFSQGEPYTFYMLYNHKKQLLGYVQINIDPADNEFTVVLMENNIKKTTKENYKNIGTALHEIAFRASIHDWVLIK
ncbi:TPA: hypothetical protein ACQ53F_003002 [Legionella pneumophila]